MEKETILILISILGFLLTVGSFFIGRISESHKKGHKEGKQEGDIGQLGIDINYIKEKLSDISKDLAYINKDQKEHNASIIRLEEGQKAMWRRIDEMREEVHSYDKRQQKAMSQNNK